MTLREYGHVRKSVSVYKRHWAYVQREIVYLQDKELEKEFKVREWLWEKGGKRECNERERVLSRYDRVAMLETMCL